MIPEFDELKELVADANDDLVKFGKGNKSAARRLRKRMQDIKRAAQAVRLAVVLKKVST